jgi:anti-sigma factor RsiW
MTPLRLGHLDDDELSQLADGVLSIDELREIDAHLAGCKECQEAVAEALRGLAILARASDPPSEMSQLARARRWAAARDPSSLLSHDEGDIAEVGGRGMDETTPETDKSANEEPDESE